MDFLRGIPAGTTARWLREAGDAGASPLTGDPSRRPKKGPLTTPVRGRPGNSGNIEEEEEALAEQAGQLYDALNEAYREGGLREGGRITAEHMSMLREVAKHLKEHASCISESGGGWSHTGEEDEDASESRRRR
jgi:hypothetical protein